MATLHACITNNASGRKSAFGAHVKRGCCRIGSYELAALLVVWSIPLFAQQRALIEEIIVTAQRVEEDVSKVPIAISAFSDAAIEDRQIINIADLQINVPGLAYIPTPFSGSKITIRGIGVAPLSDDRAAGGPSTPLYINGVSAPGDLSPTEFFDMTRIEVLRGPQGTLYGRNATAGAINLVTRRPDFEGIEGYVQLEAGNYSHRRMKGAINVPVGERVALRFAGMGLERDGYILNKAADDLPDVNRHIDNRGLHGLRITGEWRPSDHVAVWLMHERFHEDDRRVRITNLVCRRSELPNLGCDPDEFGLEMPNPGANLGTILAARAGIIDPRQEPAFEFPRPSLSLRAHHSDVNPRYEFDADMWMLGLELSSEHLDFSVTGSYFDHRLISEQDFSMDVGQRLRPTPENPSGLWPTSAASGAPGALRGGGRCDLESGRAGVAGGCTFGVPLNRVFAYDHLGHDVESFGTEARLRSKFDGPFNFLLGVSFFKTDRSAGLYTFANSLDALGLFGSPSLGIPQLYPSFIHFGSKPRADSYAAFAEAYVALSPRVELTVGLRYHYDDAQNDLAATLFSSANVAPLFGADPDDQPIWIRTDMLGFLPGSPDPPSDSALALAGYYEATEAIQSATDVESLLSALRLVPPAPRFGEGQDLAGLPRRGKWDTVTGRAVVDWQAADAIMTYLSYSQGYRPGGINVSPGFASTYDSERVHALELGAKTRWAHDQLVLNVSAYFNDHRDLQIARGLGGGSITENLDAQTMGFELEGVWRPSSVPGFALEFSYTRLHSKIRGDRSIDPLNRTQNDSEFVNLRDSDLGPLGNSGYIAPIAEVKPLVALAESLGFAEPAWGRYDSGIPVYFSRGFLEAFGVSTSEGIPADLSGNALRNTPPHALRLGLVYTWPLDIGSLTLRYDIFSQDRAYGREFNTPGDRMESWSQQNVSAAFTSASGRWSLRAWVRNLTDADNVLSHSLTNDLAGNFRYYFLSEPRIFGVSVRYEFGPRQTRS